MGFILSKIIEFFSRNRNNFKIIIVGMQNAGKTTILYRLSLGQFVKTNPTIGSNAEEIKYDNVIFQAWDLGGQESTRSVWDVYYMNTDAVVYVIDSVDEEYYEESKSQFHKVLNHQMLKNTLILILANKQDQPGAKTVHKIIEDYELDKIKDHIWHIQPCSALKGEGLETGIKWLSEQLVFRGKNNFPINPYDNNNEITNQESTNNVNKNKDINIIVNDNNDKTNNNNNNININALAEIKKREVNLESIEEDNNINSNNNIEISNK